MMLRSWRRLRGWWIGHGQQAPDQQNDPEKTSSAIFAGVSENGVGDDGAGEATLSATELRVEHYATRKVVRYSAEDLIGAHVELSASGSSCVVRAYGYRLRRSRLTARRIRERFFVSLTLRSGGKERLQDIATAHRWCMAIVRVSRGLPPWLHGREATAAPLRRRRFLIYVNPVSGRGKAPCVFRHKVAPMLREADVDFELVTSQRPGHAREHVMEEDLSVVDCVMIVSGDGLMFEVINGLMERSDKDRAILTPLSIVPTGSGNAMAASLLHASREPYGVVSAVFSSLKGRARPMDLLHLSTPTSSLYSALSFSWGLVSDIDLESEVFRHLGQSRFLIGFVQRMVSLRRYKGRFAYLPANEPEPKESGVVCLNAKESGRVGHRKTAGQSRKKQTRSHQASTNVGANHIHMSRAHRPKQRSRAGCSPRRWHTKSSDINASLSDDWVSLDGEFSVVVPLMVSHISSDISWFRNAQVNDGLLHILVGKGNCSRRTLFKKFLFNIDSRDSNLLYVKARAFRLEPERGRGNVAVDGEAQSLCSYHGVVHPGRARLMMMT